MQPVAAVVGGRRPRGGHPRFCSGGEMAVKVGPGGWWGAQSPAPHLQVVLEHLAAVQEGGAGLAQVAQAYLQQIQGWRGHGGF